MSYLYRFEARGIQGYILGHRRLRRVIGASAIVRELVDVTLVKLMEKLGLDPRLEVGDRLMSAAGMAMVRFPDAERLRQFLRIWPVLVASKAPGLRTVQAWVAEESSDAATQSKLNAALDQARQAPPVALPAGTPVMDRSPHRKLPALPGFAKNEDGEDEVFDPAGLVAMRKGGRVDLAEVIYAKSAVPRADWPSFPSDLQALGDRHYIGIIHADGNGIGTWFREDISFKTRQQRSTTLKDASMKALRDGIATLETTEVEGKEVAGVPILFGGDDLVMVVRGDQAMGFIEAYTQTFDEEFAPINRDRPDEVPISLSVGVAFVRPNHAFYLAHRLASTLGKAAKEASKRKFSSVWFHRFSDLLDHDPTRHECPLELNDTKLAAMIEVAERITDGSLPRGPIRRMLAELEDERYEQATLTWTRYVAVQTRRSPTLVKALLKALDGIHADLRETPYLERDNQQYTPWADINALAVVQRPTVRGRDEKKGVAHG